MGFELGQTAVIVEIPEALPAVGRWRARFDTSAAVGVPPHVTVVFPFLALKAITAADRDVQFLGAEPVADFLGTEPVAAGPAPHDHSNRAAGADRRRPSGAPSQGRSWSGRRRTRRPSGTATGCDRPADRVGRRRADPGAGVPLNIPRQLTEVPRYPAPSEPALASIGLAGTGIVTDG
jgi:hypothetical protein